MAKFKPYQIVIVNEGEYKHYAETISMPTPQNTIMIRAIPDDPMTLKEVSINQIELPSTQRKKWWIHYATVRGIGSFPIDMLRYDWCAPADFLLTKAYPYFNRKGEAVTIGRLSDSRNPHWTVDRWASFLWGIRHLKTLPYDAKR